MKGDVIDEEEVRASVVAIASLSEAVVEEHVAADVEVVAVAEPQQDRLDQEIDAGAMPGAFQWLSIVFDQGEVLQLGQHRVDVRLGPRICFARHVASRTKRES